MRESREASYKCNLQETNLFRGSNAASKCNLHNYIPVSFSGKSNKFILIKDEQNTKTYIKTKMSIGSYRHLEEAVKGWTFGETMS